jgi:uncharacterized protein YjbI with pentapeptide repeats
MQTKNFKGQDLRGKSFKNQDLTGADFSGCDLRGVDFSGADLTDAKFCNARMGRQKIVLLCLQLLVGLCCGLIFFAGLERIRPHFTPQTSTITDIHIPFIYITIFTNILFIVIFLEINHKWINYLKWFVVLVMTVVVMSCVFFLQTAFLLLFFGIFVIIGVATNTLLPLFFLACIILPDFSIAIEEEKLDLVENFSIYAILGFYLRKRANKEEPYLSILRNWTLKINCWRSTEFAFATLNGCDFSGVDLKYTRFKNAKLINCNFKNTKNHQLALFENTPLEPRKVRELTIKQNLSDKAFNELNLIGLDLRGLDLSGVNFANSNLSFANLSGSDLTHANLSAVTALGTCFNDSKMTGACIENWNIDTRTQLQTVDCAYVFLKADKSERNPLDGEFAAGEFSKLYQHIADTIDFIVHSREELDSLIAAIETIKAQGNVPLFVQTIERKDSSVVLRVKAPPEFDREQIYKEVKKEQKKQLKQIKADYEQKLLAKDNELDQQRKHNDLLADLLKDAMQRPVTIHNQLENNPMKIDNSRHQSFDGTASNANINFGDNATLTNTVQPVDNNDEFKDLL